MQDSIFFQGITKEEQFKIKMLTFLMCFQRLAIALKIVDREVVCLNCSNLSVVTFFGHHVEIDVYHRCLF